MFDEGAENGYFIKRGDGSVWQYDYWVRFLSFIEGALLKMVWLQQAGMAWVDFTNPEACTWYKSKLKELMDMGVDCFKVRITH